MKMDSVTPADLGRSVIAVPPLARDAAGRISDRENRRLVAHLRQGGVSTVLYGGNANLYHMDDEDFEALLDALPDWVDEETWVIPSIGPTYAQLLRRARSVGERGYPTAMALPFSGPATAEGTASGLRHAADALGAPLVLYVKWEGYLPVDLVRSLVDDGVVCGIKYAVVRDDPSTDAYLESLVDAVGTDVLVSGIGERPAVVHLRDFGLAGYTSGSVCVAPEASMELLRALHEARYDLAEGLRERFLLLEDLRDGFGPIQVLHAAVREAGIADTGPIPPLLSEISDDVRRRVRAAATELLEKERKPAASVRQGKRTHEHERTT